MGTIIDFPAKQCQETNVNFYGLELFVESCGKLLNTFPAETRSAARQEFDQLVENLVQFTEACQEARRSE